MDKKNKKGQEEMVGFGVIILLVVIIGLFFLWFSFSKPKAQNLDDYEAKSFLNSMLQYTTVCKDPGRDYKAVNDLFYWCYDHTPWTECKGGIDACETLNKTLDEITSASWDVGGGSPVKGYEIQVSVKDYDGTMLEELYTKQEGNLSGNSRGAEEKYFKGNRWYEVVFNAYY